VLERLAGRPGVALVDQATTGAEPRRRSRASTCGRVLVVDADVDPTLRGRPLKRAIMMHRVIVAA